MLHRGFQVSAVFCNGCPNHEKEAMETLRQEYPELKIYNVYSPKNVLNVGKLSPSDIAVGFTAGYFTGAKSVAELSMDEGMFGYCGIQSLMERLKSAAETPNPLEPMVERYGLVI